MARILVADDEPAIAEVIRVVCEMDEHDVRTTGNVQQAVAEFIDFDPHLMILDRIFKPAGGADAILEKLDQLGGTRDCMVVIVTGGSPDEAGSLAGQERVRHVIRKPFDVGDLRNTVRGLFGDPPVDMEPPARRSAE